MNNFFSPGQIYLADQRGISENKIYRRNSTFNDERYYDEQRKVFGRLEILNDEILAAGKTDCFRLQKNTYIVIIPITGEVIFKDKHQQSFQVDVGNVFVSYQAADSPFEIVNPYQEFWVNFLYIALQADEGTDRPFEKISRFDFEAKPNELIKVVTGDNTAINQYLPFAIYLGRFDGRKDALLSIKNKKSTLFAFVIAGAFELQGRLMHERDGLALWELDEADMEALSNNAIVLLLEMN